MTFEAFFEKFNQNRLFIIAVGIAVAATLMDCLTTQYCLSAGHQELNPIFGGSIYNIWLYKLIALTGVCIGGALSDRCFGLKSYIAPATFGIVTIIPVLNNMMYVLGIW